MSAGEGILTGPFFDLMRWVFLALLLVKLFALIDCAALRKAEQFEAVGKQNKIFWLVILAIAVVWDLLRGSLVDVLSVVGLVAALVYLVDVRPVLRSLGKGGPGGSGGDRRTGRP